MDKTIENDGKQDPKLSEELQTLLSGVEDEEAREKITNSFKTLEIQRMHHKTDAEKTTSAFEEYKKLHPEEKPEEKVDKKKKTDSEEDDSAWKEKVEFLIKHKEFDPDELEVVATFAKGSEKTLEEVLKIPAVEGALKSIRDKKAAEKASMGSNDRSEIVGDDTLLGKLRAGKLSEEEFRKNFHKIQQEFAQSKHGNRNFE